MNTEKQRIAIAEACGWKHIKKLQSEWHGWIEIGPLEELPDYLNDLNAMHEAEKRIDSPNLRIDYYNNLCSHWTGRTDRAIPYWWLIHEATAAQRAEAFLKTIGKWEDGL